MSSVIPYREPFKIIKCTRSVHQRRGSPGFPEGLEPPLDEREERERIASSVPASPHDHASQRARLATQVARGAPQFFRFGLVYDRASRNFMSVD